MVLRYTRFTPAAVVIYLLPSAYGSYYRCVLLRLPCNFLCGLWLPLLYTFPAFLRLFWLPPFTTRTFRSPRFTRLRFTLRHLQFWLYGSVGSVTALPHHVCCARLFVLAGCRTRIPLYLPAYAALRCLVYTVHGYTPRCTAHFPRLWITARYCTLLLTVMAATFCGCFGSYHTWLVHRSLRVCIRSFRWLHFNARFTVCRLPGSRTAYAVWLHCVGWIYHLAFSLPRTCRIRLRFRYALPFTLLVYLVTPAVYLCGLYCTVLRAHARFWLRT